MPRKKERVIILVDNREQLPYSFSDYEVQTVRATLQTGDYSVAVQKDDELIRYDNEIAVERKMLDNFVGDVSNKENRERFEASVKRGSLLKYYAVLIEGTELEILQGKYEGQINPNSIINTKIGWSIKHRVPIEFVGNRFNAEHRTYTILTMFLKYKKQGLII